MNIIKLLQCKFYFLVFLSRGCSQIETTFFLTLFYSFLFSNAPVVQVILPRNYAIKLFIHFLVKAEDLSGNKVNVDNLNWSSWNDSTGSCRNFGFTVQCKYPLSNSLWYWLNKVSLLCKNLFFIKRNQGTRSQMLKYSSFLLFYHA